MRRLLSLLLLPALVAPLSAQTVPPALVVKKDGVSVPLGLRAWQTEVRIHGSVAETTTTMTFANPLPRVMEGDLYFPLPEGATISGYALDIGGVMVDGVAVEKHQARQVFEQVERQGIDPGLVQWTAGNNFQTRVFPIPPNGSRTLRVSYVTELLGDKDAPLYQLPLRLKEKLHDFSLRVEVVKPAAPPKVTKGELANFAFAQWHDSYVAQTQLHDVALTEDLVVALPPVKQQPVVVEKAADGQTYFAIEDFPLVPQDQPAAAAPRHVVLFWDASGSRGAADHRREIGLVTAYFERCLEGAAGASIRVDLVLQRNVAARPEGITLTRANLADLTGRLNDVSYDGGTQLGAIGPLAEGKRPDCYLLFTDGISTFGREEPARLDAPLYVFSADAGANHALLHSLAMTAGGRYFNLAQLKDADVVPAIGQPAWSFLSAAVDGGQAEAMYPALPQPIAGRFLLAGKLKGDSATVTINYGIPGRPPRQQTFRVLRSEATDGSLLAQLWAQKRLADLMIFQKRNKPEITALGKHFGIVTPYTSLLVLDSLQQYVEHEIAPPKALAAMREEYNRQIDTIEHQKRKEKADKLAEVLRMWDERVKWWQAEYKYPKDFKYKGDQQGGQNFSFMGAQGAAAPTPGAPAPIPASASGPYPAAPPSAAPPAEGRALAGDNRSKAASDEETAKEKQDESGSSSRQPGIVIQPWQPDTPYLKELQAAAGQDLFAVYMKNRAKYGNSPAFFLDCADFFREHHQADLAVQVLSNIAELELEDAALVRVLGHRLVQIGQLDLAVETFEHVLELRPEEPQSYRDLALTLAQRAEETAQEGAGSPDAVRADYVRAMDLFTHVVMDRWDGRFPEIEVIALEEVNRVIPRAKAAGVLEVPLDPRLVKLLDVDVRIVMTWHADNTDIDLWVTEPSTEKAFYGHNRTTIGGMVSRDFTQGYGPEEYMVRRAAHGVYKIEANYYGSRATRLLGAVTVQVDVFTNYGRPNQQRKSLTLRLKDAQETVRIGEIEF